VRLTTRGLPKDRGEAVRGDPPAARGRRRGARKGPHSRTRRSTRPPPRSSEQQSSGLEGHSGARRLRCGARPSRRCSRTAATSACSPTGGSRSTGECRITSRTAAPLALATRTIRHLLQEGGGSSGLQFAVRSSVRTAHARGIARNWTPPVCEGDPRVSPRVVPEEPRGYNDPSRVRQPRAGAIGWASVPTLSCGSPGCSSAQRSRLPDGKNGGLLGAWAR
jgi:hypothetical protein